MLLQFVCNQESRSPSADADYADVSFSVYRRGEPFGGTSNAGMMYLGL